MKTVQYKDADSMAQSRDSCIRGRMLSLQVQDGGQVETGFTQFHSPELVEGLHRWYDAKTGKWISRDPIGATGGVNLYSYTSQNPVNIKDVLGLCPGKYKTDGEKNWKNIPTHGNFCGKDYSSGEKYLSNDFQKTQEFELYLFEVKPKKGVDQCCFDHDYCAYKVRMGYTQRTITDCNEDLVKCAYKYVVGIDPFDTAAARTIIVIFGVVSPHEGDPAYGKN